MANVRLTNLNKNYGSVEVLKNIDLEIKSGEFCVFVGPSGCGKSTLLRSIAGLEDVTSGDVHIGDDRVNDMRPKDRGISMVFQSYALFPHKTVYENIAYGLRIAKVPKKELEEKVAEAARALKLEPLLQRKPANLSGGQRQRVAIGRSIVRNPRVFLFDEPLSNLDAALRVTMRTEIGQLHSRLDATMIYVTHDQVEAMTLADKIVVLRDGIIEQVGTPVDLYERPDNTFVAQFIGSPKMNLFTSEDLTEKGKKCLPDADTLLGMRPEHMRVSDMKNGLVALTPTHSENLGEYFLAYFESATGEEVIAKLYEKSVPDADGKVYLETIKSRLHRFNKETGLRVA
ncbi:MAG: sn-glycerol-3-phosphate ABC transporter ATP-binding protein UgpC [Ascidiaceihabitans sp.]|jgi:ABC-type sugar transport system ATPase subunit|nr:sn-glycerol-3-phosphate ABC transporter ATP-binding protein UgpC [Ascidiaceihabitans sp.]